MIEQLAAAELASWRADPARPAPIVLDVREPWELAICRIEGAQGIPLGEFGRRLDDVPRDQPIVCVCHHGGRSQRAAMLLRDAGIADVYNLRGGVAAWADEIEPSMARY